MTLLPAALRSAMIAAAPGGKIRARISFLVAQINPAALSPPYPVAELRPGTVVARMGCPNCTDLVAVEDSAIAVDWEAVPSITPASPAASQSVASTPRKR